MLKENLAEKHVLIVGEGSLLDEGIAQILTQESDLFVSRATYSDELAFVNMVNGDQPDVILVCESGALNTKLIIDLVSSQIPLMGLLIIIRLNNNVIEMFAKPINVAGRPAYRPRHIVAKTRSDLLEVLRREHHVR